MLQEEFEKLVKLEVSEREFEAIHLVYMNSDYDKFQFAQAWVKMNRSRIELYNQQMKRIEKHNELVEALTTAIDYMGNMRFDNRVESVLPNRYVKLLHKKGIEEYITLEDLERTNLSTLLSLCETYRDIERKCIDNELKDIHRAKRTASM